jgi:RCC1 and BTB domain-containing protein
MSSITDWPLMKNLKTEFVSNIKFFCCFGTYGREVIIVTKDDKVFTFWAKAVSKPGLVKALCGQKIIDIAYGSSHVLALTQSGKCFSWGFNNFGQLGNGTQKDEHKPKLMSALIDKNLIQIVCGSNHSLVLTKSGELYGFGFNYYGQIGCGNTRNQLTPIRINGFNGEKIASIACGRFHSLALTEKGHVYSWGLIYFGQLSNAVKNNHFIPQRLVLNNNVIIKNITCGSNHILLLTTDDDVYALGGNNCGQIGIGNRTYQSIPVKINGSQKFKEIKSFYLLNISVAKAVDNYCYVWGECENGCVLTPKKTEIKSIEEIFAKYSIIKITPKPIYLNSLTSDESSTPEEETEEMLKLFNNPINSDLKFKIEDKEIYVNKYIIETNSKYFESKFKENTRPSEESTENETIDKVIDVIEITKYSYDVYYAFLKYIYTDFIDIKTEKAMDLLVLANNHNEECLKKDCIQFIKNTLTVENVCYLYCDSIKYNFVELENICVDFAKNNMKKIFKTEAFHKMDKTSMESLVGKTKESNLFKKLKKN